MKLKGIVPDFGNLLRENLSVNMTRMKSGIENFRVYFPNKVSCFLDQKCIDKSER